MKKKTQVVMLPTNDSNPITVPFLLLTDKKRLIRFNAGGEFRKLLSATQTLAQHLYLTSNDEIKEGDWFYKRETRLAPDGDKNGISNDMAGIFKCTVGDEDFAITHNGRGFDKSYCFKIIATTDPKLTLNKISSPEGYGSYTYIQGIAKIYKDFIQAYIKAYNEGNPITEVMVEYEVDTDDKRNWYVDSPSGKYHDDEPIPPSKNNLFSNPLYWKPKLRPNDNTVIISRVKEQKFTREDMLKAFEAGAMHRSYYPDKPREDMANEWMNETYPNI